MEELNIAALLKNCPKDTKLYSPIFGNVWFQRVRDTGYATMIDVTTSCNTEVNFYSNGKWNKHYSDSEVMLFPSKTQRDWNKFQRPIVEGDVVVCEPHQIFLVREWIDDNSIECHIGYDFDTNERYEGYVMYDRIATEHESKRLFETIEKYGYHWNPETKTLEKVIQPKFKAGDKVVRKGDVSSPVSITGVGDEYYYSNTESSVAVLPIVEQYNWELVPDKFDTTTLKPFDKVLVRRNEDKNWRCSFFSHMDEDLHAHCYKYVTIGGKSYPMCIPYEGNEHLLGKTDECDEYFKNW